MDALTLGGLVAAMKGPNMWVFDRRCDLARWLRRLADVVMGAKGRSPFVCVREDETIDGATVKRLLLVCLRRARYGADAVVLSHRSDRVIAAVVTVVDDASFGAMTDALRAEMAKQVALP